MRAAVFQRSGSPMVIERVPDPTPRSGQILVEVERCGICGSDLHMTEAEGLVASGSILGHEFSGIVADANGAGLAAGARITALPLLPCWQCAWCASGDLFHCADAKLVGVTVAGGYAEAVAVDARLVQVLPAGVSFDQGALVEPLAVGRRMVGLAEGLRGAQVLVLGGGPVGAAAIVFAQLGGAAGVVVSEPNAARRTKALELGATAVIDPSAENVGARARALCDGPPAIVFECVGRPGMFDQAIKAVGVRGQIVSGGASFQSDGFVPIEAVMKEITIRFSAGYTIGDFAATIDALARREIEADAMVTKTVPLAALPETFEALRGAANDCKVMVDIKQRGGVTAHTALPGSSI